jgi:hypothetical protein
LTYTLFRFVEESEKEGEKEVFKSTLEPYAFGLYDEEEEEGDLVSQE